MAPLKNLDVVRALNAPTRAAATRRRRLRKLVAICLFAAAALTVTGGGSRSGSAQAAASPTAEVSQRADLKGRHLISLPINSGLVAHLKDGQRVNVWNSSGKIVARNAPIVLTSDTPKQSVVQTSTADTSREVLIGLRENEIQLFSRNSAKSYGDGRDFTLSLVP